MPDTRLVLFDLDGTLADTAPDLVAAVNAVAAEYGRPAYPEARLRPLVGLGGAAMLTQALGRPDHPREFERMIARFVAHYVRDICVHTRLFDGMCDLLKDLHSDGIRWGVVTNKPHAMALAVMHRLDQPAGCAVVIGAGVAAAAKPSPKGLALAAAVAGVAIADTWYVGDDERDIVAAARCPMRSVAAGWGYIQPGHDPHAWGADAVAMSPRELVHALGRSRRSSR